MIKVPRNSDYDRTELSPWMRRLRRVHLYLFEHSHLEPCTEKLYSALREYPYDDFMSEDDIGLFLAELEDE
jgi:hypothetical protein